MPAYDYHCLACNHKTELLHSMADCDKRHRCPKCGVAMGRYLTACPTMRGDLNDFSTENGGKGRWNPQLREHVTSVNDAVSRGKARGWSVAERC